VSRARLARTAGALGLLLLCACAQRAGGTAADPTEPGLPGAADELVLQVSHTGGFVTPEMLAARLPLVSVYADGRVLTEGPVPAIHPGPALPNVQVGRLDQAGLQALVDRAVAAGVAETADLGEPPVADAPSTRFTLVTTAGTHVREAYALDEAELGLTAEQQAARAELAGFRDRLSSPGDGSGSSYEAGAVAAVVTTWVDGGDGLTRPDVAWPGPALPGEPMAGPLDLGCVVASGDHARAVLAAARTADAATPWVTPDGRRWAVLFRPLLPDETSCADLAG
jgi:hypothetical protein